MISFSLKSTSEKLTAYIFNWNRTVHSTIDQLCTGSTTEEYQTWRWNIVRKNPFSLQVLAAVKVASSGFNLETQGLPSRIEEQVKKYQDLNERIKSIHLMD